MEWLERAQVEGMEDGEEVERGRFQLEG